MYANYLVKYALLYIILQFKLPALQLTLITTYTGFYIINYLLSKAVLSSRKPSGDLSSTFFNKDRYTSSRRGACKSGAPVR